PLARPKFPENPKPKSSKREFNFETPYCREIPAGSVYGTGTVLCVCTSSQGLQQPTRRWPCPHQQKVLQIACRTPPTISIWNYWRPVAAEWQITQQQVHASIHLINAC